MILIICQCQWYESSRKHLLSTQNLVQFRDSHYVNHNRGENKIQTSLSFLNNPNLNPIHTYYENKIQIGPQTSCIVQGDFQTVVLGWNCHYMSSFAQICQNKLFYVDTTAYQYYQFTNQCSHMSLNLRSLKNQGFQMM